MCDRVMIINQGRIIASGTMAELRAGGPGSPAGSSADSLEDIFLALTGGAEYTAIAEVLE